MKEYNNYINLTNANFGTEYTIKKVNTDDEELNSFLLTLGCYENQPISVISKVSNNFVIVIKNARYTIDANIASAILV